LFDKALNSIDGNILFQKPYNFIWKKKLCLHIDRLESQPGFTELRDKLKSGFYKCICLFVDNSGFDIILGILPFAIELLKNQGTKVLKV
jgi:hypothetical protein